MLTLFIFKYFFFNFINYPHFLKNNIIIQIYLTSLNIKDTLLSHFLNKANASNSNSLILSISMSRSKMTWKLLRGYIIYDIRKVSTILRWSKILITLNPTFHALKSYIPKYYLLFYFLNNTSLSPLLIIKKTCQNIIWYFVFKIIWK